MTEAPTIFITGATDGLGRALAGRLAANGATLILHGRDAGKLELTAAEISTTHGVEHPRTVRANLADLAQVRKLASDVRGATGRLDVFVSNAGIGGGMPDGRERRTSADGYELRFAVNYLAGFLLTLELLPLLRRSGPARIVNVASIGQHPIDFSDIMITRGFNSLHPATFMPTKMVLEEIGHHIDSIETGVTATRRLVSDPALAGVTGRFYDRTREAKAAAQAYDASARAELWQRSLALTGHSDIG